MTSETTTERGNDSDSSENSSETVSNDSTTRGNDPRIFTLSEGDERLVALESGDILDLIVTDVSKESVDDGSGTRLTVSFRDADGERTFYAKRLYEWDGEYQSPLVETTCESNVPLTYVQGVAE